MSVALLKEKMADLAGKMENGSVVYVTRRPEAARSKRGTNFQSPREDEDLLPTSLGTVAGLSFKTELIPYPDGGYILDISVYAPSPFRLELFLENHEVKSLKFKSSSLCFPPVEEIEIGVPEFDKRYYIEAMDVESVHLFLLNDENRRNITDLGEIDKLSIQPRFVKLNYFIGTAEDFDAQWIYERISSLSALVNSLKNFDI
jgi:hypothetical protein